MSCADSEEWFCGQFFADNLCRAYYIVSICHPDNARTGFADDSKHDRLALQADENLIILHARPETVCDNIVTFCVHRQLREGADDKQNIQPSFKLALLVHK